MSAPPEQTVRLAPILLVNFISMLGFTIVLPFLVFLVERMGGNAFVYGLIGATYPAFQFIGAPILGRWSDRLGRRRVLLLSQIGTLISWIVFAGALFLPVVEIAAVDSSALGTFTITLPLLVIGLARALDGLTGGNISVANAYVADVSSEADRSANFGKMGVAANLGTILGPTLAGLLGATVYGARLPVAAAVLISAVGVLVIARALPDVRRRIPDCDCLRDDQAGALSPELRDCLQSVEAEVVGVRAVLAQRGVRGMVALYFTVMLAFSLFYVAFPIHAASSLGWHVTTMGAFFGVLSAALVIVQGPILTRVSRRVREKPLILAGLVLLAGSFVLMRAGDTPTLYGAAVVMAVGNGIMWPSVLSLLSKTGDQRHQGAVQGVAGSAGSLASIFGLLGGGLLYGGLGASIFLIPAVVAAIAFGLATRVGSASPGGTDHQASLRS